MPKRVAVLGLGTMGGRVAAALAEAGHDVSGYDPLPEARERARTTGVRVGDESQSALVGADLVLTSVPLPEHVTALAEGPLRSARESSLVVDLSTIDPATARRAAATLSPHGVDYVDAPVLGRPAGCGSWTLVVGGPADRVEELGAVLEGTIARRVVRVGDVGAGSVVKVLNNLMFGAINAVTAEALHLCERSGIEMSVFVDAVIDSGAATVSNLFRDIAPRIASGDHDPVFALDLLAKDNRLAAALVEQSGASAPMVATVSQLNQVAVELGYGARDSSAVIHAYDGVGAP